MSTTLGTVPGKHAPAEKHPEMGRRKPKPPPRNANAPVAAGASKINHQTSKRSDFMSDTLQTQASKFRLIWNAKFKNPSLKLVALAMANFSNADGTSIRPAIATVARMCLLSPKQTRRHIQELIAMCLLTLERGRISGGRIPTHYALNLKVLSSLNPAADGSVEEKIQPSHTGVSTLPPVTLNPPTDGSQPSLPTLPSNVGEGGVVPTAPSSTGLAHSRQIPAELRAELFDALVANGPGTSSRISALIDKAHTLVKAGHDINAMAEQALEAGWKRWPQPPPPLVPPVQKNRATARSRALLIDPGRDTRAAGRDYDLPGVKP